MLHGGVQGGRDAPDALRGVDTQNFEVLGGQRGVGDWCSEMGDAGARGMLEDFEKWVANVAAEALERSIEGIFSS